MDTHVSPHIISDLIPRGDSCSTIFFAGFQVKPNGNLTRPAFKIGVKQPKGPATTSILGNVDYGC